MSNNQSDEATLIHRYFVHHDPAMREEIILKHLPLVHFVLGRLGLSYSLGADYEDAKSQGLIGLIEAVDNYNPDLGTQFSTYATLRIRGRVLDYLRSLDWLSRSARKKARAVEKAINDLWGILQRSPTDEELAEYLGYDLDTLQQALIGANHIILSLDSLSSFGSEGETTFYEILADKDQPNPADVLVEEELKIHLIEAIKSLSKRQQILLALYYYEELTFKEIGEIMGISESRVCQLHARAIMDLRALLSKSISPSHEEPMITKPIKAPSNSVQFNFGRSHQV